ncbi:MAG: hypothetical protein Q8880_13610, partial [Bacteroidota bacterium]|nr:hypothetical protein [Bacteroidota bacterium]
MSRILEYFSEYIDKYNQFEKVLSNIKRYEYSDDEKYSIMPLYFQRGFKAKGRDTDKGKAIFSYGFDSYDKLIYIKNGKLESFILYFDESINLFCFEGNNPYSNEKTLSYIQITELISKDQLYGTVKVNRRQEIKVEKYYYENGRMIKIENPIDFEYGTYNDILNIQYDN